VIAISSSVALRTIEYRQMCLDRPILHRTNEFCCTKYNKVLHKVDNRPIQLYEVQLCYVSPAEVNEDHVASYAIATNRKNNSRGAVCGNYMHLWDWLYRCWSRRRTKGKD